MAKTGWSTDYEASLAKAKAENKMVLMDFTGSDWCPACMIISRDVFAKPEFQAYAKDNLELVEVDFPMNKPQSADVKVQNAKLQEQYGIEGFPTIVVLNSDGKKIAQTVGYAGGGAKAFIAELEKLKNK
jgi:protein disulfide-isomerase